MNVLVFSQAAWDDKNSVGNTLSNLFSDSDDNFYHFYTRKQHPNNDIKCEYLNISALDAVKGLFRRIICDCDIVSNDVTLGSEAAETEIRRINRIHNSGNKIVYYFSDMVWISRIWMKKDFKEFVEKASPDVFFAFAANPSILLPLIEYLKQNTHAKVVLFAVDDVNAQIEGLSAFRKHYQKKMYIKCINSADYTYGISESLCEKYSKLFNKPFKLLRKGCDFQYDVSTCVNNPIRLVYSGNLLFGRLDTLEIVGKILDGINGDEIAIVLDIYTTAMITDEVREKLSSNSIRIMGSKNYEDIKRINNESDYILIVESFEKEQINSIQYSFSTKIIDCLQSGSGAITIGPAGIETVEYMRTVEGAIVIDDLNKIEDELKKIVSDPNHSIDSAKKIRNVAMCRHNISIIREELKGDLRRIVLSE